jgi:hypothetical protein
MRVFLGSTFSDLVEHRKAVADAIKSLDVPYGDFQLVRAEDRRVIDRSELWQAESEALKRLSLRG